MFFELTTILDSNFKNQFMEHFLFKEYLPDYTEKKSVFSRNLHFAISLQRYQQSCQLLACSERLCMAKLLGRSFVTEHKGNNSLVLKWEFKRTSLSVILAVAPSLHNQRD